VAGAATTSIKDSTFFVELVKKLGERKRELTVTQLSGEGLQVDFLELFAGRSDCFFVTGRPIKFT
jgi:hypothetical protein